MRQFDKWQRFKCTLRGKQSQKRRNRVLCEEECPGWQRVSIIISRWEGIPFRVYSPLSQLSGMSAERLSHNWVGPTNNSYIHNIFFQNEECRWQLVHMLVQKLYGALSPVLKKENSWYAVRVNYTHLYDHLSLLKLFLSLWQPLSPRDTPPLKWLMSTLYVHCHFLRAEKTFEQHSKMSNVCNVIIPERPDSSRE